MKTISDSILKKSRVRFCLSPAVTLLFLFGLIADQSNGQTYSFTYGAIVRNYIVHLPAGYNASKTYPLVINMHGYTSNASQQQMYSQMDAVADTAKFIVVYPNGVNNAWNCGFGGFNPTVNDVGFLSALIDTMKKKFSVNPNKIFSCGMSLGGFMSYRIACELNSKIAAIASVTGLMADSVRKFLCQNSCTMPVLDIHGTTDPVVNYNGASGYVSADSTIRWWRTKDGCPAVPVITNIPDVNTADGCTATKYYYGLGNDSSEVIFFKITNGGHTWPGGIAIPSYGNTNQDFKASGEIWKFFRKHSLKCGAVGVTEAETRNRFGIYPNPSNGRFEFQLQHADFEIQEVEIFNTVGAIIFQSPVSDNSLPVDISDRPAGLYLIRVKTENSIYSQKIITY